MADTSYSNMSSPDNRGDAVSELLILPGGRARVHGILADGQPIRCGLHVDATPKEPPSRPHARQALITHTSRHARRACCYSPCPVVSSRPHAPCVPP